MAANNSDEVLEFYLSIIASLKTLQSERLSKEKFNPLTFDVHVGAINTFRARWLRARVERQRQRLARGYHAAVRDCIKKINKEYKEYLRCIEE